MRKKPKRLSCENYGRMPFDEKVIEHILRLPPASRFTTNLPRMQIERHTDFGTATNGRHSNRHIGGHGYRRHWVGRRGTVIYAVAALSFRSGKVTRTEVPFSLDSIANVPPMAQTRSRIPRRPTPPALPAAIWL